MIPKKIHYCWFGGNPLPEDAKKCIASWRKFMPDYEIIEWNESNFDVNAIPYTAQAYEAKKYAFVSDYARFKILYDHGGIYFDTDVEVIKPFDDIVAEGPFMGFETDTSLRGGGRLKGCVNPGLGLGANPGLGLYLEILEMYANLSFFNSDGSLNLKTIVSYSTEILIDKGLKNISGIQNVADIKIYPSEYFNPLNDNTGRLRLTQNTHSIHWYSKSWLNESNFRRQLSRFSHRIFGTKLIPGIKRAFKNRLGSIF